MFVLLAVLFARCALAAPADPSGGIDPPFDFSRALFSGVFSDHLVLQMAPARAALFGTAAPGAAVTVRLLGPNGLAFTSPPAPVAISGDPALHGTWKVLLPAQAPGFGYNLTATCAGCADASPATLADVGFGSVYLCSGQSNMECPVLTTTARFETYNRSLAGDYDHIRMFQVGTRYEGIKNTSSWILPGVCRPPRGQSCPNGTELPGGYAFRAWMLPRAARSAGDDDGGHDTAHFPDRFSAVCWYFGKALADAAAAANPSAPPVPIGLIASTIGGTTLQQWTPPWATGNDTCLENNCGYVEQLESYRDPPGTVHPQPGTLPQCTNHSLANVYSCPSGTCSTLWHSMIAPFVNYTIEATTWYQGEQNVLWGRGSAAAGYQCQLRALIESWRRAFSAEPGTTAPDFPFGVVTLAGGASEGGYMWTNFTHLPKAQWQKGGKEVTADWTAGIRAAQTGGYGFAPNAALPNVFLGQNYDQGEPCGCDRKAPAPGGCWATNACFGDGPLSLNVTHNYQLSGIHPRVKHIVGQRLARALLGMRAGRPQPTPKLAGCRLTASQIILNFDAPLLGGEAVAVQAPVPGAFIPLELQLAPWNASNATASGWAYTTALAAVNATAVAAAVPAGAAPTAVRYAWGDYACCPGLPQETFFCPPSSCPIATSVSGEPAVPFWAAIVGGKCQCDAPWVCDA